MLQATDIERRQAGAEVACAVSVRKPVVCLHCGNQSTRFRSGSLPDAYGTFRLPVSHTATMFRRIRDLSAQTIDDMPRHQVKTV